MDFFFCIPIAFGCPTKIRAEGDGTPRVCPRCNNASVFQARSRTWFELCFVPLIPMRSSHIWMCSICQWSVPMQQGWEPAAVPPGYQHGPQNWQQGPPSQQGYQPGYQPGYQLGHGTGPK